MIAQGTQLGWFPPGAGRSPRSEENVALRSHVLAEYLDDLPRLLVPGSCVTICNDNTEGAGVEETSRDALDLIAGAGERFSELFSWYVYGFFRKTHKFVQASAQALGLDGLVRCGSCRFGQRSASPRWHGAVTATMDLRRSVPLGLSPSPEARWPGRSQNHQRAITSITHVEIPQAQPAFESWFASQSFFTLWPFRRKMPATIMRLVIVSTSRIRMGSCVPLRPTRGSCELSYMSCGKNTVKKKVLPYGLPMTQWSTHLFTQQSAAGSLSRQH